MAQVLESCRIVALAEKFWQEVESKQKWNGAYKTTECSAWWVLQKKKVRCKEYHRKKVTHRNEFLLCFFVVVVGKTSLKGLYTFFTTTLMTEHEIHTHTSIEAYTHYQTCSHSHSQSRVILYVFFRSLSLSSSIACALQSAKSALHTKMLIVIMEGTENKRSEKMAFISRKFLHLSKKKRTRENTTNREKKRNEMRTKILPTIWDGYVSVFFPFNQHAEWIRWKFDDFGITDLSTGVCLFLSLSSLFSIGNETIRLKREPKWWRLEKVK